MANPIQNMISGGGLSSVVDEVTGSPNTGSDKFRKFLKGSAFDELGDSVDLSVGEFIKAGQFTVPAQERYRWGYGAAANPENQGYIYFDPQDATPNPVTGEVRIQQRDAQERSIKSVEELDIDQLRQSKSDRQQMIPLPEAVAYPKVGRDSKLTFAIRSDGATEVVWSNSEVVAPTAVYPVRNV